ncbi:MAG: hypothetical protein WCN95_14310 [bacterium]
MEKVSGLFFPMVDTNGWVGVDVYHSRVFISIVNDCVGKPISVVLDPVDFRQSDLIIKRFYSRTYPSLTEEEAEKVFDAFLFDGNKRVMYRTFNPDEQYYEYDALQETLTPVTTNRVVAVKRIYKDLYRFPLKSLLLYWDEDASGRLSPQHEYYHPLDQVKDAVPPWQDQGHTYK